jgi:hypothetical protein
MLTSAHYNFLQVQLSDSDDDRSVHGVRDYPEELPLLVKGPVVPFKLQAVNFDALLAKLRGQCSCNKRTSSRTSCLLQFSHEPLWSALKEERRAWSEMHKLDQDRAVLMFP